MVEFLTSEYEKRDRIINAALEEFGKQDFKKASTNNIVKAAGVSKGLLYHYFENKQALYDYLIDFVFRTITDRIRERIDDLNSDFLERIKEVTLIKIDITKKYPSIYDFAIRLIRDNSMEEVKKLSEKYALDLLQRVYSENVDFTLFKSGIKLDKVIKMTQWTFEKYAEELCQRSDWSNDDVIKEVDEYIEILRMAFYK